MKKFLAGILALSLMLFALGAMAESGEAAVQFTTTDIDGNTVTQDIFQGYDLTMVNVWATWCGFCLKEMPDFPALKDALPENVNLITICEDAESDPELVQEILTSSGANFMTLVANDELYQLVISQVSGFPTTFFVDSNGQLVGEAQVGVPGLENVKDAYLRLIEERLALLEG